MAYTKYSLTPADNNAAPPNGAPEGMLPSAVNDTMRDMMAQIRDVGDGIRGGTYTMTAPVITGGSITGVALSGNTLTNPVITGAAISTSTLTGNTFTNPVISGGSINNTPIGATTAATGKFTTLEATGVTTVQAGTAAAPAITTTGDTNTGIFFPAADTIAFSEGGVEAARLNASGNLGVGTTSPTVKLQVQGSSSTALTLARFSNASTASTTTKTANIALCVADTEGTVKDVALLTGYPNGVNAEQGGLAFSTRGAGETVAERMRIDSDGNLLVGTTNSAPNAGAGLKQGTDGTDGYISVVGATSSSANVTYRLYSTGAAAYRFYVGYNGTISATNTTITSLSDVRFKENIRDLDDGLEKIMALKPRKFDWKEGKGANIKNARGFIAQEFETIFPDMIEEWLDPAPEGEEPYKGVNANLIPTLVKAIQELKATVDAQAARIAALESVES
jgi:hypothetical protein